MLIYVAAAIAIWIAVNVFFVIWMGGGVRRSSSRSVGPGWVPDILSRRSAPLDGAGTSTSPRTPHRTDQWSRGVTRAKCRRMSSRETGSARNTPTAQVKPVRPCAREACGRPSFDIRQRLACPEVLS